MKIRDRIKELRRVRAGDLIPDPRNWRSHPQAQQDALCGILSEVGYADALLVRETDAGLVLIDGHLRAETTPDQEVPVLVLDVTEEEAAKLLAVIDPLASMAEANEEALGKLLAEIETDSEGLAAMLEELAAENGLEDTDVPDGPGLDIGDVSYRVIVEVTDETQQSTLIERLESEGLKCLPLMS